jgi:hypothetical protein
MEETRHRGRCEQVLFAGEATSTPGDVGDRFTVLAMTTF